MTTYVWRNIDGKMDLVDKATAVPLYDSLPATQVIRDGMAPTVHMADGKIFDSKRAFRAHTRATGHQEVGDQKDYGRRREPPKLSKRDRVESIKHAIHQLSNGGHR